MTSYMLAYISLIQQGKYVGVELNLIGILKLHDRICLQNLCILCRRKGDI